MLSNSEYLYTKDLLINYYNNGYHNYVCITNTNDNNNESDLNCYVSKNIDFLDNHFQLSEGYSISFDFNDTTSENTINKLNKQPIDNISVLADNKEFIYSSYVGYSDMLGNYSTSLNNHLDLNFAYALLAVGICLFIYNFLKFIFKD